MIAKAIKEEHPRPRPLHLTVEHWFKGYPFLSMLVTKIGGVPAHPANVHRLLHDEQQLVLVFPEGAKATEKLYKDRYRLRRFGRGGFVEAAARAGVPIVPVAVMGAEESMPTFAQVGLLKRLTGLIYFPVTPLFPHFGLLGATYLPAKFRLRFLPPVRRTAWARRRWRTAACCRRSRTRSAGASRTRCSTWSAGGAPCGWDDRAAASSSPACRPTGAAGSRRRWSATRRSRRSSASAPTTRPAS